MSNTYPNSQNFVVYDTTLKKESVAQQVENISAAPTTPRYMGFMSTRNRAVAVNDKKFEGHPNGLVQLKGNWDLSTDRNGRYLWIFSKTLEHDPTSFLPSREDVDKLLDYFITPTFEKLQNLPSSRRATRKLEDPTGGLGFEPICEHQCLIVSPEYIPLNSGLVIKLL